MLQPEAPAATHFLAGVAMQKNETFASLMNRFTYRYDLRTVFEDFLTMSICAVTRIPGLAKSYYEDEYMDTIAKYKNDDLRHVFPKLFAALHQEMLDKAPDNDVLGNFYEQGFSKKNSGQFFTPYHICKLMAEITIGDNSHEAEQRILDPTCGSGRTILAAARKIGPGHEYYGIDIDHTCTKMTALNLFFNNVFNSEVMCADALKADDFRISYRISLVPFGIFKITEKEKSKLWWLYKNSFPLQKTEIEKTKVEFITEDITAAANYSQLKLF